MNQSSGTLRKAAILMASLDAKTANRLLSEMSSEQAEAVRTSVNQLRDVSVVEQEEVIEEFFRIGPLLPERDPDGVTLELGTAEQTTHAEERVLSTARSTEEPRERQPFEFLRGAPGASLAHRLRSEHPQTIAVVVSHLPPHRGAELLAELPASLQSEVADRLMNLDETDPEVLQEIERGLEAWVGEQERLTKRRTAGMAALQNILAAADPNRHYRLLSNLTHQNQHTGPHFGAPSHAMYSFLDLSDLDDGALAQVLSHARHDTLTIALAGAARSLAVRAMRLLPAARGARLRRDLEQLGPTRLAEVDQAQQELANLASELEARGELTNPTGRKLSLAI